MKEKTVEKIIQIGGFALFIALLILLIILGPLATIAALNTVFGLQIAYSFWTWLGVAWLQWLFVAPKFNFKK